MSRQSPSVEAARQAFEIAAACCGSCLSYHAVWPYLRLLEPARGVDADRGLLVPLLRTALFPGARVLLAGSADTGVAELVLEAAGGNPVSLTVVDTCETPLAQCRALPLPPGSHLEACRQSITGSVRELQTDLVLAHSVLAFLKPEELDSAGAFLAGALSPGGYLVLTTGLSREMPAIDPEAFCSKVLSQMEERGIPLPCDRPGFAQLLRGYASGRKTRANPFADEPALRDWLEAQGLEVLEICAKRRGTRVLADGTVEARATNGAVVLARKPLSR